MALLLDSKVLEKLDANKKSVHVFNWLKNVEESLPSEKEQLKSCQRDLQEQLNQQITELHGPAIRCVLGRCFGLLFSVGNSMGMRSTITICHDVLKNPKDDSAAAVNARLTAMECLGNIYLKLGRMAGPAFQESAQLLFKAVRYSEQQGKAEILQAFQRLLIGLADGANAIHKDIYKLAKSCLTDKSMSVRCAAARCLLELKESAVFVHTTELDAVVSACVRGLDGASTYEARCTIAALMGSVLVATQQPLPYLPPGTKVPKRATMDEALGMLVNAFVRGSGDLLKSTVTRELRVGVTQAFVTFLTELGLSGVERHMATIFSHLMDLLYQPKAMGGTHVEAVYTRRCIAFILRRIFGRRLGEAAQLQAARIVCQEVMKRLGGKEAGGSDDGDASGAQSQHAIAVAMQELGGLLLGLSTLASTLFTEGNGQFGMLGSAVHVALLHPSRSASLAAAWCMRCAAIAMPFQLTPLVEQCLQQLSSSKASAETIQGYGRGLAALLGCVRQHCPLGLPQSKSKAVFSLAEEILRSASQNTRMALERTRAAWTILSSLMTLGTGVVRPNVPRMLLLWRNAFPRSGKEVEAEKSKYDLFQWQVTLAGRSGALCAVKHFVQCCPELLSDDVTRRVVSVLECALSTLSSMHTVCKQHGVQLKASATMVRFRLYQSLQQLSTAAYENLFGSLLREMVADFTLTDNPASISSSLLRSFCHTDDSVLLGSWIEETDDKLLEDQLQGNSASGSGALEHDLSCLYAQDQPLDGSTPGPLPLGVAVIDASVALFGQVFPRVASKHRQQLLSHFGDCIRTAKAARQQQIQINIFTAFLAALRGLVDHKSGLKEAELISTANQLIMGALASSDAILRCAAGEALGRMAQVVDDGKFLANTVQACFETLKTARDAVSRTGHSLVLGCLHRYTSGMSSGHHLNTSVGILQALAQDNSSPTVQVWSLHALALIADTGGPLFRSYVQQTLTLVVSLMLTVPSSQVDVHQCLGRCLQALVTTLGPELVGGSSSVVDMRTSCLAGCAVMLNHPDAIVRVSAIQCLQQIQLFAPACVALTRLVPCLCDSLSNNHLLLRRAAASCLRQLVQRQAQEVMVSASQYGGGIVASAPPYSPSKCLEAALLGMLDVEVDRQLRSDICDTITSLLSTSAPAQPRHWLMLCYAVLSAAAQVQSGGGPQGGDGDEKPDDDEDNEAMVTSAPVEEVKKTETCAPCWPSKVFAVECVEKIMNVCRHHSATHVDFVEAKKKKASGQGDFLVLQLLELVRTAFMASTGNVDSVRIAGLKALKHVIEMFAHVPDVEYAGHALLEQYQAQIAAALRPAFAADTPPDVTAAACQVCSTWISSGVSRELSDLKAVQTLMVSSLSKVRTRKEEDESGSGVSGEAKVDGDSGLATTSGRYNESTATMEKLAVLTAWAEVYINARQGAASRSDAPSTVDEFGDPVAMSAPDLLQLVLPELQRLRLFWLLSLRDLAMLELPAQFAPQLPPDGGAFYSSATADTATGYYAHSWPPLLLATAYWMNSDDFKPTAACTAAPSGRASSPATALSSGTSEQDRLDRYRLVLGLAVKSLCSSQSDQPKDSQSLCVRSLLQLFSCAWPCEQLAKDKSMLVELLSVLHRVLLTADLETQKDAMQVVSLVLTAYKSQLAGERTDSDSSGSVGEGGEDGDLQPGQSVVFVALEVCLSAIVRTFPMLSPQHVNTALGSSIGGGGGSTGSSGGTPDQATMRSLQRQAAVSPLEAGLAASAAAILTGLPELCTASGGAAVLPTLLFLLTGMLCEASVLYQRQQQRLPAVSAACLQALKAITSSPMARTGSPVAARWQSLLASAMLTVIEAAEQRDGDQRDPAVMLLAIAVFAQSAPPEVAAHPHVQSRSVDVFAKAFAHGTVEVQRKCIVALISIFQCSHASVSVPFIHALGGSIVDRLQAAVSSRPSTDEESNALVDCMRAVEVLLAAAEDTHRTSMMGLLVPLLIDLLVDNPSTSALKILHNFALERVKAIGPKFPAAFKAVIAANPALKQRLESALRGSATSRAAATNKTMAAAAQPAQPTIKLKMNFGKF